LGLLGFFRRRQAPDVLYRELISDLTPLLPMRDPSLPDCKQTR
jgi:hypothetical protein